MVARPRDWVCLLARWTARIISVLLALMVLAFLVATGPRSTEGLTWQQFCQFAALGIVVAGLLAAWEWEWPGALGALLGLGVFEAVEFSVRGAFGVGALPWFAVPAVLYLLASWLERPRQASRLRLG